jgi:hypothetical protein
VPIDASVAASHWYLVACSFGARKPINTW